MNRIVIAAPGSGTGKTSIALGLMRAFSNRGLTVQPFKIGPDYIDPAFHNRASRGISRNLDLWMLPPGVMATLFGRQAQKADISIIEGVMGLYDGIGTDLDNRSTAHVSRVLDAPVILVIDGRGVSASAAALVKGFQSFDPRVHLAGVIVNQVSGEKHYAGIRDAIEQHTGIRCFGWVRKQDSVRLESRHLGLVPSVEIPELEEKLDTLASLVSESVDLDGLMQIAQSAPPVLWAEELQNTSPITVRIGYALDEAFNFYYADNLDLLKTYGAELVPFSPIHDGSLPENLSALYFGGGFPEMFASELAFNGGMLKELREAAQSGMPIFAECGGFMYLMDAIRDFEGNRHEMCGILPGTAVMTQKLQRFGYVSAIVSEDSVFGPAGTELRGHEFHRSVRELPETVGIRRSAYALARANAPETRWHCGENTGNILAAYAHVHFHSNPESAKSFVDSAKSYADRKR